MKRREFIKLIGGALATWPFAARAQQAALPVIGILGTGSLNAGNDAAFRQGLKDTGFVDGENVTIQYRWAEGQIDRLPALAAELARLQAAVIVAVGGTAPAKAAKAATAQIPIVFISGGDPITAGLVASMNRPGGNITGVSFIATELVAKRLELLHQFVPKATVIGVFVNPHYSDADLQRRELQEAAGAISQKIRIVNASTELDIDTGFATLVQQKANALLVANDPFFSSRHNQIVALAARYAVPAIYSGRDYVRAGGLMSYGPNVPDTYLQASAYTSRILKGAKPADLPVLQPTKFNLIINLKTAKALGLTVPLIMQMTADEVIE